ncbi:hypothetical protein, partial [Mesorhizobium sp. B3-2-1]|uniref:hypothetical protein n=1 Tax=Mesorhizobium sp. B3-2-1 TaxID=2589891 RepID=UPI001AED6578
TSPPQRQFGDRRKFFLVSNPGLIVCYNAGCERFTPLWRLALGFQLLENAAQQSDFGGIEHPSFFSSLVNWHVPSLDGCVKN